MPRGPRRVTGYIKQYHKVHKLFGKAQVAKVDLDKMWSKMSPEKQAAATEVLIQEGLVKADAS